MPELAPILVAEDEQSDAIIIRMAAEKAGLLHPLVFVQDGFDAIEYLRGEPPYSDRAKHPLPGLLLLDLKMPRRTGFDVLAWLSAREDLRHIPAIVLSSSTHESDITRARRLGAADYHVKPHRLSELTDILKTLEIRWLSQIRLPPPPA